MSDQEKIITMAFDAFRLVIGIPTKTWAADEVAKFCAKRAEVLEG